MMIAVKPREHSFHETHRPCSDENCTLPAFSMGFFPMVYTLDECNEHKALECAFDKDRGCMKFMNLGAVEAHSSCYVHHLVRTWKESIFSWF